MPRLVAGSTVVAPPRVALARHDSAFGGLEERQVLGDDGIVRLWDGETLQRAIASVRDNDIPLISIMHTEVRFIDASLDVLQANWSKPIGVYAHSSREGTILPGDYAAASQRWLGRGVQVLGTCCGLGVEHIEALAPLFE